MAEEENIKMPDQYTPEYSSEGIVSPTIVQDTVVNRMVEDIRSQTPKQTGFDRELGRIQERDSSRSFLSGLGKEKLSFKNEGFRIGDAYDRLNSGEYIAKFDNFIQGTDNEERFANEQSTSNKWSRGVGKFFGKTGTAILGGTVGAILGGVEAITTANWESVWDNDFQDKMDDWNKKMDNSLANYYTEEEKNKNFLQSMGTANFWANDFLGGLSFTVGAIAGEALWATVTGGASIGIKAARWAARLGETGRAAVMTERNTLALAKALKKGTEPVKDILNGFTEKQIKNGILAGKVGAGFNNARMIYTSAGYEAGVEARTYIDEQRQTFLLSFEEMNGRKPTPQEKAEFEGRLRSTANSIFSANLALVGSSNLAMYGQMFNMKNPLKTPGKMLSRALFGGGVEFGEKGVASAASRTIAQRISGTSYSILRGPFIEGVWEEGLQGVASTAGGAYLESTYNDNEEVMGLMESIYEGFSHTYGTKEGFKEVGLGMLIGLVGGGGSSLLSGRNPIAETVDASRKVSKKDAEIAKNLNTYSSHKFVNEMYRARLINAAIKEGEKADQSGDLVHGQAARSMGMMANIIYAERMGYGEEVLQEMRKALEGIDAKEVASNLGITEAEAVQMKDDSLAEYEDLRAKYKKNSEFAEYVIGAGKIKGENINHEIARESLAYQMVMGDKFKDVSMDYTKAIMAEVGDNTSYGYQLQNYFQVQDTLRRATKEDKQKFQDMRKEHKQLTRGLEMLEKIRLKNSWATGTNRKGSKGMAKSLEATTNEIIAIQEKLSQLEAQLEGAYSAMSLYAVEGAEEGIISGKELAEIDKNLNEVEKYFRGIERTNPEKSARIKGLVAGYRNSMTAAKLYSEVIEDLLNPETGLTGSSRTFLSKLKEYNEPTQRLVDNLRMQQKLFAIGAEGMFGEQEQANEGVNEEDTEGADISNDVENNVPPTPTENTPPAKPKKDVKLTKAQKDRIEKEYGVIIEDNLEGLGYDVKADSSKSIRINNEIETLEKENIEESNKDTPEAKDKIEANNAKIKELKEELKKKSDVQGAKQEIANLQGAQRATQQAQEREKSKGMPNFTEKIQEFLKKNNYILQNFGENVEDRKPTDEELARYEELLKKMNIDPDSMISQSINTISKRGFNKIGLTKDEVIEFKELNQKLSDWRVMDGVGEGDTSLAEVIEQKKAYDEEVKKNEVNELSQDQEMEISHGVRNAVNSNMSSEMVNTPETVMARRRKGIIEISHLKVQDLVDKGGVVKKNGNEITDFNNLPKGVYTVEFGDQKVTFSLKAHQRLEMDEDNFSTLLENAGMASFKPENVKGSSWLSLYERQPDGSYRPMPTNFTITEDGSEFNILDPQALYSLKSGEELFFKLSLTDSFNIEFREEFMDAMEAYENDPSDKNRKALEKIKNEIYEQVSIYVVSGNNDVVGNLKGVAEDVEDTPMFKAIRRYASEIMFEKYSRDTPIIDFNESGEGEMGGLIQTMYSLPFTTKVTSVFIGSPNLTVEVDGDNISVVRKPFTDKSIKMVKGFGIVENGEVKSNEGTPINTSEINTQFIDKIDAPTPFVVIEYENQKVAYPISVSSGTNSLGEKVQALYDSKISNGKLAAELINTLAENGVDPTQFNIRHIGDDSFFGSKEEQDMIAFVENRKDVVSQEEFLSKEYNMDKLKEQGEISVDLENKPFQSPKIKVDLKSTIPYVREAQAEERARFEITGKADKITLESIANQLLSKKESELSQFHKKVLSLHEKEIKGMVKEKIKLSSVKAAQSQNQKNKPC